MPTPRQRLRGVVCAMGHRRNKTSLLHDLTRTGGQAQSQWRTLWSNPKVRHIPVKSPLHDVGQLALGSDDPTAKLLLFLRTASWWSQTGSNRRPHACKARALPTELRPLYFKKIKKVVGQGGLEPPTSRLSSARSNQLSYKPEAFDRSQKARLELSQTGSDQGSVHSKRKRNEDGGAPQIP